MLLTPDNQDEHRPHIVRLVLGGYNDAGLLWSAYSELNDSGISNEQLCAFLQSDRASAVFDGHHTPDTRQVDGIHLSVSSGSLFDMIRLSEVEPFGKGAPWMPAKQAEALWRHIRDGRPALLALAHSPDEQVSCSRLQLRHRPCFLHTFNFSQ
jgi:hypothetical protein